MDIKMFIFYLIAEIMMGFITLYFYKKIYNVDFPKINVKNILLLLTISIVLVLNNFYNLVYLRTITSLLLVFLTIKLFYKVKVKDAIIATIVYSVFSMLVELLLTIVLVNIPDIDKLNDNYIIKTMLSVVHSIIMFGILSINRVTALIRKTNYLFKLKYIFSLVLIVLYIFFVYRAYKLNNVYILILTIILCIFILITIRIIINDRYNINILKDKNDNLKESYKAYSDTIDQCREFKHNIKNDLFALKSKLNKEQQVSLNNIINKYNKNYDWINRIDDIPDGLQGVFYLKQEEAKTKKISMLINTNKDVKVSEKDYFDFCDVIGILLDNAMEASLKSGKKVIDVFLYESKDSIEITIKNCFLNSVDLDKLGKKNYSTKEYKSGLGLNYIKNLKNQKIKVYYSIINDIFITKVMYKSKIKTSNSK